MGICPSVPVSPISIPLDQWGVPDWSARTYPKQEVNEWEQALLSLLLNQTLCGSNEVLGAGTWEQVSRDGRKAALEHVGRERDFLATFLSWLANL